MKLLKYSFIALLTLTLIGSAGYLFAASSMQSKDGYATLVLPSWLSARTTLALNLGPRGLKPVRWAIRSVIDVSDRELELSERLIMSVLQDLEEVQLQIYDVGSNRAIFERAIDNSIATLTQDNWQKLLTARQDDKRMVVLQMGGEDLISGFSVLVSTPQNVVFINLIGQLTPESFAAIAADFSNRQAFDSAAL